MKRNAMLLLALTAALVAAAAAGCCLGAGGVPVSELINAIREPGGESAAARIFWYVRLPRVLAAMLAGAALSASGLLLQSVLRNPLAAPGVIGINSGAGLGALICMAVCPDMARITPAAAFAGACLAAFAVYFLARRLGAASSVIVLAGVAVNSILGAAMDAITAVVPDAALSRASFSIGGFANVTMQQLKFAAPLVCAGMALALIFGRELKIMALGDEVACGLGLKIDVFRAVFLAAAAMLAGSAVSFAGLLGFVGLISPHMSRIMCKNDPSYQLPITLIFGAALCLVCDIVARLAFAPYEMPVGVVMSFLGAPFFLYMLFSRHKRGDGV